MGGLSHVLLPMSSREFVARLRDLPQRLVSALVPVRVVEALEVVDVHQDHRKSAALPLPGAVANRCPTTGFARAEPFAAAIGVMWEFNRRPNPAAPNDPSRDTCSEEESEIFVNNLSLTTRAGGADDWPSVAAGNGCFGDTAGLAALIGRVAPLVGIALALFAVSKIGRAHV